MAYRTPRRTRILIAILFLSLLVIGTGLILLTHSFLDAIKPSPQQTLNQVRLNKNLLLLGMAMIAGLPAIGIGTYLAYFGSQIRTTSSSMKGPLLMVAGILIIVISLALPIVLWRMTQN